MVGDRLPCHRRQCGDVPRLLLAAQDVDRDEPELHQRVHAGDRARVGIRFSRGAADALDRSGRRPYSGGRGAGVDYINSQIPTPKSQPLPTPNFQTLVSLEVGNWEWLGSWALEVGSYFAFEGSETPPADPPRNSRLPSASTKFRPTAFCVPSLA